MTETEDRAAIEELHRRDQEATRALDVDTLLSLWTEDGVGLGPGGGVTRGRERMAAQMRRAADASAGHEVIVYEQRFEEVRIVGDHAWDWGTFESVTRDPDSGEVTRVAGKLLRILQRCADGRWRFHRAIWNVDPA